MSIKYKKITLVIKFFLLFIVVFSGCYATYNIYHANQFNQSYIEKIKYIYSAARRFGPYYNNADSHYLEKGLHKNNDVSIIVNDSSETKILSTGINKLRSQLKGITDNNIWTIALLEYPLNHSYFDPLRPQYIGQYNDSVLKLIIENEGLMDTYQYFYGCNVKLTEVYTEEGTNEKLRTLYYPIYNKKQLNAILLIDIKNSLLNESVEKYNDKYATVINLEKHNNIYEIKTLLPCSTDHPIYLGINLLSILKTTFIPAILFAFLSHYLMSRIRKKKYSIQYDKMTDFYRRDFYEKKLQQQNDFNLLLIDIDHFKKINDEYGHDVGDDVIRIVAKRISHCIRESDVAIRWGGEEFIISFKRGMDKKRLTLKAEQIRKHIALAPIVGIKVTISVGGGSIKNTSFNDAYKMVDNALYHSKENGRNQVTIV